MPITTNVVSLNPAHGEVYSIQHYVVKFFSDLRQFNLPLSPKTWKSTNSRTLYFVLQEQLLTLNLTVVWWLVFFSS